MDALAVYTWMAYPSLRSGLRGTQSRVRPPFMVTTAHVICQCSPGQACHPFSTIHVEAFAIHPYIRHGADTCTTARGTDSPSAEE